MHFTLSRHGDNSPAVLVVGGIQGDEPGGFSAATLLATHYTITKGAVWIVPNLNFPSIVRNSRGLHGDMNRKFLRLDKNDPEYPTVSRIQELIRHPDVKLVLNLHDGSGFSARAMKMRCATPGAGANASSLTKTPFRNTCRTAILKPWPNRPATTPTPASSRPRTAIT
jgi:predicted deacylase